ncbi:F-box and WD domain protein [Sporothrix schenckii 1099-18]|uniref:F-box and WD domain protein n=1 Tax=Sporothrix schenckii 1099-18 TaxID=1397361 RepID=A0A0F2M022_SPOSC|nr:F-box and WD domain protein [Sporothrix schenckii 1099-18]KJR81496.1 F-box and WD domain protein [Sporothrix schenckii 1099-18]
MHRGLPEASEHAALQSIPSSSTSFAQHGLDRPRPDASLRDAAVTRTAVSAVAAGDSSVDIQKLDEKLRRLKTAAAASTSSPFSSSPASPSAASTSVLTASTIAGQRVAEYERARTPAAWRRERVVFQVVKKAPGASGSLLGTGRSLNDFPNEVLTHVFSYLQPGAHDSVALVSKRFYALITTPHAWRMAFSRFFPGQEAATLNGTAALLAAASDGSGGGGGGSGGGEDHSMAVARADARRFGRLTALASWRSEYLLRTRLLRSLMSGKPGVSVGVKGEGPGSKAVMAHNKKATAVITYNSQLPGTVDRLHAAFAATGKKQPRVVHGASAFGVVTSSNPSLGKLEGWGYREEYMAPQLEDVNHSLTPFGLGPGRAAMPNVMDVSNLYGAIVGEAFPGGRALTRATNDRSLAYLDNATRRRHFPALLNAVDAAPDLSEVPTIPEAAEAVTAVWVAKTTAVPTVTKSMVGFLTGSSLGVVSSYSLDKANSSSRYPYSHLTARWVVSPGVPIIAVTADDTYTEKRRAARRVWAVALNALGEVYYLQDVLTAPSTAATVTVEHDQLAWQAGRSVSWELVEASRRTLTSDWFDDKVESLRIAASSSPHLSPDSVGLVQEQRVAEAREIERYFALMPEHFRAVYDTWDMRLQLQVDFAGGSNGSSSASTAENIVVVRSGAEQKGQRSPQPAKVTRYTRLVTAAAAAAAAPAASSDPATPATPLSPVSSGTVPPEPSPALSIFSSGQNTPTPTSPTPTPPSRAGAATGTPVVASLPGGEWTPRLTNVASATVGWQMTTFSLKGSNSSKSTVDAEITCSAIDLSLYSVVAPFEDNLLQQQSDGVPTTIGEIPGRRSRWLAVGTKTGAVIVWNLREAVSSSLLSTDSTFVAENTKENIVWPLRIIRTDSPAITSLAVSALYLVHGGSDSLVQAWDPLTSTNGPVRTLNAPSSGRIPRHLTHLRAQLTPAMFASVGAIFLDPDPTVLRGVLAVGTLIRFWSYSSAIRNASRKKGRRLRHTNAEGQLVNRRLMGEKVSDYIAAEAAELRREQESDERHRARLLQRFGVGLAGLTDEEAIRYAEILSQETFSLDEQRHQQFHSLSQSGDSAESLSSVASATTFSSEEAVSARGGPVDTVTSEPSMSGRSPPGTSAVSSGSGSGVTTRAASARSPSSRRVSHGGRNGPTLVAEEDDFELQIQRAIRLSLMEGVNDDGPDAAGVTIAPGTTTSDPFQALPQTPSPPMYESRAKGKGKGKGKAKSKGKAPGSSSSPFALSSSPDDDFRYDGHDSRSHYSTAGASSAAGPATTQTLLPEHHVVGENEDDDFQMALQLSLQEEEDKTAGLGQMVHGSDLQEQYDNDAALAALLHEDEFPALEVKYTGKGKGKGK